VFAPLAVNITLPPTKMLAEGGVIAIVGVVLIVMLAVVLNAAQPPEAAIE
jgi:hypothetical protein